MDKDLFMMVWKAVGPEITKYHTYQLEDYIKYNNSNSNHTKVDRIAQGLQLFNRCADRYYAWSIACKYNCNRLIKYLQENPIEPNKIVYYDLLLKIAENGRVEYIDLVDGFRNYILKRKWFPATQNNKYHLNCLKWIINNTNLIVEGLWLLDDTNLTYADIILLNSAHVKIQMTPNITYILRSHIGDFDNLYAAYICALNGDDVETIMDYQDPQLGSDILFIKAMVDRRSVDSLKALFAACRKNKIAIKRSLFLRYALLDGYLDTIKFLLGTKSKVSIPKKQYIHRARQSSIMLEINHKNYELDTIKFLYDKCQCIVPLWFVLTFLEHSRHDILEFYYSKEPTSIFGSLRTRYVPDSHYKEMPRDVITWLHNKSFMTNTKYLQMIVESSSFSGEDIVAHFKEHNTKSVPKNILQELFQNPLKFKAVYNYFGVKKMQAVIKKHDSLNFIELPLEILLMIDTESYEHLANIILTKLSNNGGQRNTLVSEQYIIDRQQL